MANLHLVTGSAGTAHVSSADQGVLNCAIFGNGQFVMNRGNKLSATVVSNNQIKILDGDIYMQGRHIRLNEGSSVDVAIDNGTQGVNRNDLIVARYTKDLTTALEECNLVVIKGTPVSGTAADPSYTVGNIVNENAILNDMPLYRVPISGLDVGELVCLFDVFEGNLQDIPGKAAEKHNHKASEITEGVLTVPRGGTGKEVWEANKLLYASAADALAQIGFPVAAGSVLCQDLSGAPYWVTKADFGFTQIAIGTYTGTGAYGSANPTVVSANFTPKMVVIAGEGNTFTADGVGVCKVFIKPMGSLEYSGGAGDYATYSAWHNNSIAFHSTMDATYQYNTSGRTYFYAIFG